MAYNAYHRRCRFTATSPGGTAQIWDYTDVFTVHTTEERAFVQPAGLDGASLHPTTDRAITSNLDGYSISVFYDNEPDGLTPLGSYFGLPGFFP
ncbi:MAG: hypothetical protein IPI07_08725 [Flavobacteriales bacterium]|nr:hypothetical protein [Flavobacteriales bacterium]